MEPIKGACQNYLPSVGPTPHVQAYPCGGPYRLSECLVGGISLGANGAETVITKVTNEMKRSNKHSAIRGIRKRGDADAWYVFSGEKEI